MVIGRRRSRLPRSVQIELIKYFVGGSTVRSAVSLTGVKRHTATLFFQKLRELSAEQIDAEMSEPLAGEIEVDESYFGGGGKGRRGRSALASFPVFGLLKRGGKVHAVVIPNVRSATLFLIIQGKIKPDSIVCSDSFRGYDVLDVSEFHHVRIKHSVAFAEDRNHINGIENFWNQAKCHLQRFNGVPRQHSPLLKECERRFTNTPTENFLKVLRKWAKFRTVNPS